MRVALPVLLLQLTVAVAQALTVRSRRRMVDALTPFTGSLKVTAGWVSRAVPDPPDAGLREPMPARAL